MLKLLLPFALLLGTPLFAQTDIHFPALSVKGEISQMVGNTLVNIKYERPSVRAREIFGGLVPWNKVWRTGASYCTKISFSEDVKVGGQSVPKGAYSLFTIPNPDSWMVILNADTSLYGAYGYQPSRDIARFHVKPKPSTRFYETLTMDIDVVPNNANIYLSWAHTQISFFLETSTDKKVLDYIEKQLLTGKEKDSDNYAQAADYLLFHGKDLMKALEVLEKGLQKNPENIFAARIKVDIYEKLGYLDKAILALDLAISLTEKRDYDDEKYRKEDIQVLQNRKKEFEDILNAHR